MGFRDFEGRPLDVVPMTSSGKLCSDLASVYQIREQADTRIYRVRALLRRERSHRCHHGQPGFVGQRESHGLGLAGASGQTDESTRGRVVERLIVGTRM